MKTECKQITAFYRWHTFPFTFQILEFFSPVDGGGLGGVYENVVLAQFLNVALNLLHLSQQSLFSVSLTQGVQLAVVRFLLEFNMHDLPLLLQGYDQLLALAFRHQKLLTVTFILFLNLHLSHQVIFVCNFVFDFFEVFWGLAEVLLLEVVLILVGRQLWSREDVLHCVRNNEIFVGNEAVNRLLVPLGDWGPLEAVFIVLFLN